MKQFLSIIACLAGIIFFTGCSKDEQVMSGSILGFVSDYANPNTPVAGASITINGKGLTKTTGSDGRYEFADLEPGTYTLAASANGYQTNTKQVTVYVGQVANCDFQLARSVSQVEVSPLTLAFGTDIDQLTFSITNKNSTALQYTITGYPGCLTVSPASATVASMGTQTVTVRVNRDVVDKDISTTLLVNVGNDSYPVSVSISHNTVQAKLSISESVLDFGQQYTELQFTLKNTGTSGDVAWSIDEPTVSCLSVSPVSGTLAMGKEAKVTVHLNRSKMETNVQTFLTINGAGGSASIQILATIKGGNEGGETGGDDKKENVVRNALYAYFTFNDEIKDLTETGITPTPTNISYVDSYNGTKALKILTSGSLSIPDGMIDQKNSSITFWAKDLYDGHVFHAENGGSQSNINVLGMVDGNLKFVRSSYNCYHQFTNLKSFTHPSLEGWHHIAIVASENHKLLYVDGQLCDQQTESTNGDYRNGIRFVFGSSLEHPTLNANSLIIDNLRVYRYRAITADDVNTIYNYEK